MTIRRRSRGRRGVFADGAVGLEVQVALDGKAQFAADGIESIEVDVPNLGLAKTAVTESEGETARIELGQETGGLSVGGEEVDDGMEIEGVVACVEGGALGAAVGQKSFALGVRQEFHGSLGV